MAKAQTSGNRDSAREAATSAAGSADTGKNRPAPREEGSEGQDAGTDAANQAPVEATPIMVIVPNPKRQGTIAFRHFAMYTPQFELSNRDEQIKRGVRGKDLSWDADRGHILTADHAKNFPLQGTKEEQIAYLRDLNAEVFNDAYFIKHGYMPKPQPAAEGASTEQAKETANA